ncbi:MAG: hypothetical protein Q4E24_16955 [bacterium]|nr:hypothetical protein [bacterium]
MALSKDEEIALLHKSMELLEEEAQAREELIAALKGKIEVLESHNTELISMIDRMLNVVKKG